MEFHPTGTDPTREALLVCRNARWNILVLLAFLWAFPVFAWLVDGPWWFLGIFASIPILLTWPLVSSWRRRGRADNWVLAVYRDGLWLNLRDCDYHAAEPAESIVFLPFREVESVRRYVHRYVVRDRSESTHYKDVYLEIKLRSTDTGELQLALAEEWKRQPPPRELFGGNVTSRTRRTQAPIAVNGDDVVRVKFTVSNYGLRPPIAKVLKLIGRFVKVEADFEPSKEDPDTFDDARFDAMIRDMVTNGKRIDAMNLLKERKGISTTEAHQLVEELSAPSSPARGDSDTI